jgi:hypothetical protein
MIGLAIPLLLLVALIVLGAVIAIQRSMSKGQEKGSGADIVSYLILALAMGVAGFAIAELATTAFPGDRFVFDPAEDLATSLASLAVSAPFLVYFWRRQASRRDAYPASPGWTLYLMLIELVFMTAFVTAAVLFVNGLITDESASAWTGVLVFGMVLVFHEVAVRRDPPLSDANELPRVVGSAIGLLTLAIGLAGTLTATFSLAFETLDVGFDPWVAMLIVGMPIWGYRWLRRWPGEPSTPRLAWATIVTIASVSLAIAAATSLVVMTLQYVFTDTPPAGEHFETSQAALGLLLTAIPIWVLHRRSLGEPQSTSTRAYQYATAAVGLIAAVGGAIALTIFAFDRSLLVGGSSQDVITAATVMVVGVVVWRGFTRLATSGDPGLEHATWPRRLYHLGFGILFGLVSAGALITTLFIFFRRVLDEAPTSTSLLTPITIFLYTGLAAWYLLAIYSRDRGEIEDVEVVTPFAVTIIASHPGMIATRFPEQARLKVIHRGDDAGTIDDETAEAIVAAVNNRPSLVWVDEDGFRVAPMRADT